MNRGTANTGSIPQVARLKRAVIFTRARSLPYDAVREFAQFKAQVRACREVADRLGAAIVSVYEASGGASEPGVRQAVEQLLAEVGRGGITYVISCGWDRLARRPVDLVRIARRLAATGTRIRTTADPAAAFAEHVSLFCLVTEDNERRVA
jgi:DNA invertase Pin-like site-specific DNA recombinase